MLLSATPTLPVHRIEPDATGNRQFRMYQYECMSVNRGELLVPHRKDHYLLVFNRRDGGKQWIDTVPYALKAGAFYFLGPEHVVVKEELRAIWSTGIAFTTEFLAATGNEALARLPLLRKPAGHELLLSEAEVTFTEELLARIEAEYRRPGAWQAPLLGGMLAVLLTYMSRIYEAQYGNGAASEERQLLRRFQEAIDAHFRERHEVADYAALLHLSAGHLGEMVKAQSGRAAIKHIHERILMEARRLLFHTESPLKEIAWQLGFADASYFIRFFKRETGLTPAAWRAQTREMYH